MSFPFTFSDDTLSVFLAGVPFTLNNTHPKWAEVFQIVTGKTPGTTEDVRDLINTRTAVEKAVETVMGDPAIFGRVTVGYDGVLLDGKVMHTYLTTRMLEMLQVGIDIAPWAKFMDKLYSNPSRTAVNELFQWLERCNMPITDNGNFLAYKRVDADLKSIHASPDGTHLDHPLGEWVMMPRNEVDDNRENHCSTGLHFCSWSYLSSFSGARVILLEINPADVVSIPSDYDFAKGRTSGYFVREEVFGVITQTTYEGVYVVASSELDDEDKDEDDLFDEESTYNSDKNASFFDDGTLDLDNSYLGDWTLIPPVTWNVEGSNNGSAKFTNGFCIIDAIVSEDEEIISAELAV